MRIPCAKCGHIHDSTVTPFLHDNIKAEIIPIEPDMHSRITMGDFKCSNCGNENLVAVTWTVIDEKEEEEYTSLKEGEWTKVNKLKRAITNTGKVHYVNTGCWQEGKVEPFCNCKSWLGDYWGKKWKLTDKPVTCKNCLSKMHRLMKEESANVPEDTDRVF